MRDGEEGFRGAAVGQGNVIARLGICLGRVGAVKETANAHHEQIILARRTVDVQNPAFVLHVCDVDRVAAVHGNQNGFPQTVARYIGTVTSGTADLSPIVVAVKPLRDQLRMKFRDIAAGSTRRIAVLIVDPCMHAAADVFAHAIGSILPFLCVIGKALAVGNVADDAGKPAVVNDRHSGGICSTAVDDLINGVSAVGVGKGFSELFCFFHDGSPSDRVLFVDRTKRSVIG